MTPKTLYYNFCKEHITDFPYNTEEEFYSIENQVNPEYHYSHHGIIDQIKHIFPEIVKEHEIEYNKEYDDITSFVIHIKDKYIRLLLIYDYDYEIPEIDEIIVNEVIPQEKTIIEYIIKE